MASSEVTTRGNGTNGRGESFSTVCSESGADAGRTPASTAPRRDAEGVLYTELWLACARSLVMIPHVGERVFYFPQGHTEQVIAGSFIANGKKETTQMNTSEPIFAPGRLAGPGGVSQGTMRESSDGPGAPLNQSIGTCNNSNQQGLANITWN